MASAKEILAERLAKGEITSEQYDTLLGKIGDGNVAASSPTAKTSGYKWLLWPALGVSLVVLFGLFNGVIGGLSVNNISAIGDTVEVTLVNDSDKSGDVAVRVTSEASGAEYCRVVVAIGDNTSRRLRFRCGQRDIVGTFGVSFVWAGPSESSSLPRID